MDHNVKCKIFRFPTIILQLTAEIVLMTAGCTALPKNFDRPKSYAFAGTEKSALGQAFAGERAAHPGLSGFHLLGNGLDAFVARAVLCQFAERSIDVQYFIYHDDLVGRLFSDLLAGAADRGVRVRLLVDDIHLGGRNFVAAAMDAHPNIEVRIFNPFSRNIGRILQFVTRFGSVTRRMHNKTFTVDNQFTILGGRNIGNEYFEADPDLNFEDLDVMAIGPVVMEVSTVFDRYWNSELAYPVAELFKGKPPTAEEAENLRKKLNEYVINQADSEYLRALRNSDLANKFRLDQVEFGWGDAEVVYDQPEKLLHDSRQTQYHLSPTLTPYFEGVKTELIIFSPYFVPGKSGTAFLTQLAKRGVRVRILTNSLASNDVGIVHAGYMKFRKELLRGGVELYELNKKLSRKARKKKKGAEGSSKASLHAKSFVFDRKQIFIGSLNLDPVALQNNTEIGVVLKVPEIAEEMAKWFDKNINQLAFRLELKSDKNGNENIVWNGVVDGKEHTFYVEPYVGFWRRLGINILSIFPIESHL